MKKICKLLTSALLISHCGLSQQQLKFSKMDFISKRVKRSETPKSPDSSKTQKLTWTQKNIFYANQRDQYYIHASIKQIAAQTIFDTTLSFLNKNFPASIEDNLVYKTKLQAASDKKNSAILEAKYLRNEGRVQDYYFRTAGKFNYLFQPEGFVKNDIDAQLFYVNDTSSSTAKFLNTTLLTIGTDGSTASLFNEIYADYWGPVRIGLGILLNNNQASSGKSPSTSDTAKIQQDAIQTLIGGGSNGVFNASIPLLSWITNDNTLYFKTLFSSQIGANVPKIGTSTNNPTYNWQGAIGGSGYYIGLLKILNPYFTYKFSFVGGSTDFYKALNKADNKAFWLNQTSLGVSLNSTISISYNIYYGDHFVKSTFPHSFSVSIIPR